jgi:hypothetical protein
MPELFRFYVHWKHQNKMYVDEICAAPQIEAEKYFNDNKRDDVTLVRVEFIGPDDGGVREFSGSPYTPFSPLIARRRLDIDEDAR